MSQVSLLTTDCPWECGRAAEQWDGPAQVCLRVTWTEGMEGVGGGAWAGPGVQGGAICGVRLD